MDLDEPKTRLCDFCRAVYGDPAADVTEVHEMPDHAGFGNQPFRGEGGSLGPIYFKELRVVGANAFGIEEFRGASKDRGAGRFSGATRQI